MVVYPSYLVSGSATGWSATGLGSPVSGALGSSCGSGSWLAATSGVCWSSAGDSGAISVSPIFRPFVPRWIEQLVNGRHQDIEGSDGSESNGIDTLRLSQPAASVNVTILARTWAD